MFPHPAILLHGIGAGDLEIDLSDQKAGGWKSRRDEIDFSDQKKRRMNKQEERSRFARP